MQQNVKLRRVLPKVDQQFFAPPRHMSRVPLKLYVQTVRQLSDDLGPPSIRVNRG